jgi:Tfp pilus assembly pilus retraction ATPase PilT
MGLILVGPTGSGKSSSLTSVVELVEMINPNVKVDIYYINPKAVNKIEL